MPLNYISQRNICVITHAPEVMKLFVTSFNFMRALVMHTTQTSHVWSKVRSTQGVIDTVTTHLAHIVRQRFLFWMLSWLRTTSGSAWTLYRIYESSWQRIDKTEGLFAKYLMNWCVQPRRVLILSIDNATSNCPEVSQMEGGSNFPPPLSPNVFCPSWYILPETEIIYGEQGKYLM